MSKSLRIVLVDPLGEVLFSGESLSLRTMLPNEAPAEAEAEEGCPVTLRSATSVTHESGVYPSLGFLDDSAPETLPESLSSSDEIRSVRIRAA